MGIFIGPPYLKILVEIREMKKNKEKYINTNTDSTLKSNHILLLGDSIIDNKSYVQSNELDVTAHLEMLFEDQPEVYIHNNAVDGYTMSDLIENNLNLESTHEPSHIIISIGGNDLLGYLPFLQQTIDLFGAGTMVDAWAPIKNGRTMNPSRNTVLGETYFDITKPFTKQYETIVANLSNHRAKLLLCTVYEGDLVDSDEFSDVNNSSKTMVSLFNDIVYRTSNKYSADVLELREIFVRPEDYANPIEPSHIGGGKLAKAIQKWVNDV